MNKYTKRDRAAMHLINAVIAAQMLIRTNGVVVHPRRDFLLPCPLCWSVFIWFLGLGFRSDQFLFWVLFLGFLGFGNLRKKSGRRKGWKEDGKEWVLFVLTKNKEKKDILGLGPKTKGKWGKKKNEGRRKASGNLTL